MCKEDAEPPELTPGEEAAQLHLAAVGSVAGDWALLETHLDSLALELANIDDPAGLCFTAQISGWARKLDAYLAVARLRGAKRSVGTPFDAFAKAISGLAEQRNRVVHDPWLLEDGIPPQRLEISARKKLRSQMVTASTDEIIELSAHILTRLNELLALHDAVKADIAASRHKLR